MEYSGFYSNHFLSVFDYTHAGVAGFTFTCLWVNIDLIEYKILIMLMLHKKSSRFIFLIFIISMLLGCATTHYGDGIVIAEQKIIQKEPVNYHPIKNGAKNGALIGALGGGATALGLIAFLGASPIAGVFLFPILYGTTLGTAIGSGAGIVAYALNPKNSSTYQYKVKSLTNAKILTIQQQTLPIPLNAKVRILERNGSMFIRKK